jgi:UDP-hydrolysing UDP-N-acetyl-D-glucosamine 2-epimerase
MPLDVLAVTGTRADWGLLVPVLRALRSDPAFRLRIAVTGQHLMSGSMSLDEIREDGFVIDHRIDIQLADDSPLAVTKSMGLAVIGFADLIDRARPDLILLLGDRFEIHAVASAALVAKVPVAHLSGGDLTEGAIDDAFRHGITKMAHLHFVTSTDAARRVVQLGEDPARVFNVGSPALDRIREIHPMAREAFFAWIGLEPRRRNLMITFHPITLADDSDRQCKAMLDALATIPDVGMIFTGSNADPGARAIDDMIKSFVSERQNTIFIPSLGFRRYITALSHVDAVVGNSSSGLTEAPSFGIPTVNIGNRQQGRLQAASIIDCEPTAKAIAAAIDRTLALDCSDVKNPYGDGHAAERIVAVLKGLDNPAGLIAKTFWQGDHSVADPFERTSV